METEDLLAKVKSDPDWQKPRDLAAMTGIACSLITYWCNKGMLNPLRINKRLIYVSKKQLLEEYSSYLKRGQL